MKNYEMSEDEQKFIAKSLKHLHLDIVPESLHSADHDTWGMICTYIGPYIDPFNISDVQMVLITEAQENLLRNTQFSELAGLYAGIVVYCDADISNELNTVVVLHEDDIMVITDATFVAYEKELAHVAWGRVVRQTMFTTEHPNPNCLIKNK